MSTVALAALDPLDTCPTPDPALARSVTAAMHAMGDSAHDMRRHAAPRDWRGDEADLARHVMTRTAHDLQGAAGAMASGAIAIGHYTNLVRTVLQPAHRALEARRSRLDSDARMMQQLAGEADDEPSGSFQDGVDAHNRQVHTLNREIRAWNRRLEAAQSSLVGSLDRADSVPEGRRIAAALSEVGYRFTTPSAPAASTETSPLTKLGHLGVDLVGLVPGLGEPADGANALWYWFEGDRVSAGASLAGMIPFLGWGAVAGKNGRKAADAGDGARSAARAGERVPHVIDKKIRGKMAKRGWTDESIDEVLRDPVETIEVRDVRHHPTGGGRNDEPATAYLAADGHYVVRNDVTGDIVQVTDRNKPDWKRPW